MHSADLSTLQMRGLLAQRAGLTYARLEGEWYRPHEIFTADQHGWPGDWEGRTILALALLAQATHREPAWLEEILRVMPKYLNKKGYFGPPAIAGCCAALSSATPGGRTRRSSRPSRRSLTTSTCPPSVSTPSTR